MGSAAVSMSGDELEPGTKVGDYVITGRLGEGGMATVYSGLHPLIGKRVAVKVIRAELCRSADAVDRFVQEARAANEIGHPNLVDVFNFGSLPDGRSYFVMEWLQGRTLADVLDTDGPLPLGMACRALLEICDGLAAAHELGIVHRDLKPQNVFFVEATGGNKVKLLDFGIAKLVGKREGTTPHTQPGLTMGTPDYISPEQARGRVIDARADVYSLGVLAFEMVTGQLPFVADNAADMMSMHLHAPPRRPSAVNPLLPPAFDALVERMLAKDAALRPSVSEVRSALTHILYPPPAPPDPPPPRAPRFSPRAWMFAAAGLGILCVALVSGGRPLLPALIAFAATPLPAPPRSPAGSSPLVPAAPPAAPQPPAGGTLVIRPHPASATVLVDGVPVPIESGRARRVFTASGTHILKVIAPGHRPLEFEVVVEDGRYVVVPARLSKLRRRREAQVANVPDDLRVLDPWAKKR
jgi:serine/threonine-protein kinase